MADAGSLLRALQHGDSFFPSGAVSFSGGLETLSMEAVLSDANVVEAFIHAQLVGRWATFDRCVVVEAFNAAGDLDKIWSIDATVEAQTLAQEMRAGSRRSGLALLHVHEKLETPRAALYRGMIRQSEGRGHLSVMQGFLWAQSGVQRDDIEAVSAHTLCVGLLGAALRLGAIGHVDCQRILANTHRSIEEIVLSDVLPMAQAHTFTPMSEIAVMRHEVADSRLFAN